MNAVELRFDVYPDSRPWSAQEARSADVLDLQYTWFLGDVVLRISGNDLSLRRAAIPLVDFASSLRFALRDLGHRKLARVVVETSDESATIEFSRHNAELSVIDAATSPPREASCPWDVFEDQARQSIAAFFQSLETRWPEIRTNRAYRQYLDEGPSRSEP